MSHPYRTPLSRARGNGAAGHGAGHWISERVGSLALVPLILWVVYAALQLAPMSRDGAIVWLGQPLNALLMVLTFVVGIRHMHDGLRVVIEDYLETRFLRMAALIANLFICVLAGGLAVISILKIALGAAL
ncbi:MAG: succinate dehydrogenase, hydrophobic membrane anchor protein [Caulobacter sp.]|jgi:succinate dehydrogenase / fumarate reductase membrane anchor subunit|nr:succinate dehydrogenase, hydrophobic membrane anchor protein [Caulobacter sp.]